MEPQNPPIPAQFALGTCFYPEHWPRDRWAGSFRQMRDLGLRYVRMAEFAWARMEPRPGEFDWSWLDEAVDLAGRTGLEVILCTPTATPPAWLVAAHPEILQVGKDGHVRKFGGRRHYDFASPAYRAESQRITRAIAGRYGTHPSVVGWQTDNEFGDHDTGRSYGPASATAFREWLAGKYLGDIDALNVAWGTVFWSQEYNDFGQIDPPNLTVTNPNPSHVLDFARFSSDMVVQFQEEQVDILRELSPGRWVTHNYMRLCHEFDHFATSRCLDFVTWDSYPTGAVDFSPMTDENRLLRARTGDPDLGGFNHDLYRGMCRNGAHWVMEQQVGHINWAPWNALPADGAVALWTAQAYAHGVSCVSYFRWRAATVAQELMHSGMLRHDETLDRGGQEVTGLELPGMAVANVQASVVILHDYESLWMMQEQPHSQDAN